MFTTPDCPATVSRQRVVPMAARAFTDGKARASTFGEVHLGCDERRMRIGFDMGSGKNPLSRIRLVPMFGDPVELEQPRRRCSRLRGVDVYRRLFPDAFHDEADAFTVRSVPRTEATGRSSPIGLRSLRSRRCRDIAGGARDEQFFSQPLSFPPQRFRFFPVHRFRGRHEGGCRVPIPVLQTGCCHTRVPTLVSTRSLTVPGRREVQGADAAEHYHCAHMHDGSIAALMKCRSLRGRLNRCRGPIAASGTNPKPHRQRVSLTLSRSDLVDRQ